MAKVPAAKSIVEAVGISPSYASMIIGGDRVPPKSLAIAIYRKTSWKHPSIKRMSDDDMTVFERHEPWSPPSRSPTPAQGARVA